MHRVRLGVGDRADHLRGLRDLAAEGVGGADVDHVRDDAGDVVRAAAAQRQLDQLLDGLLRRVVAAERLLQGLVADRAGQAVGADQVPVAGPDLADRQVGLDLAAAVQGAHQQRALRVGLGLLGGDPALVDQPLHPGVVLGDLVEPAVPQQVGAGVADVHLAHPVAVPQQRGEGAAHAFELRVLLDHVPEPVVGGLHRVVEQRQQVGAGLFLVEADDRPEHLGGGDLTGRRPAHAVGHREQAGPGVAGVLVPLADQALVRAGGEAQHETHAVRALLRVELVLMR